MNKKQKIKDYVKEILKKDSFNEILYLDGCDLVEVDNWIISKLNKHNIDWIYAYHITGIQRTMRIRKNYE